MFPKLNNLVLKTATQKVINCLIFLENQNAIRKRYDEKYLQLVKNLKQKKKTYLSANALKSGLVTVHAIGYIDNSSPTINGEKPSCLAITGMNNVVGDIPKLL